MLKVRNDLDSEKIGYLFEISGNSEPEDRATAELKKKEKENEKY